MYEMKLISILLPVYNVELYLRECLDSILRQTYDNFEVIAVDDGSTDGTYHILQEYAGIDSRIKIFRNLENLKIVKTLNFGLSQARGELIARIDGDDYIGSDRLSILYNYLLTHKEIVLVDTNVTDVFDDRIQKTQYKFFNSENMIEKIIKYSTPIGHHWLTYRYIYDLLGGYRNVPGVEDYDFILRMRTKKLKFAVVDDYYGYYYRQNTESGSVQMFGAGRIKSRVYIYKMYRERLKNGKDSYSEREYQKNIKTSSFFKKIYKISLKNYLIGMEYYRNKKILLSLMHLLKVIISPHFLYYIYTRIMYKRVVNYCK
jgi:glycosyltransferase involved in cell wall biosynthesis